MMPWRGCSEQGRDSEMDKRLESFRLLMRKSRGYLTRQQLRSLKGQALAGNIDCAEKYLHKILERSKTNE